jgi:2-keto-3-deoxy-6-phosphogluconate aldolase
MSGHLALYHLTNISWDISELVTRSFAQVCWSGGCHQTNMKNYANLHISMVRMNHRLAEKGDEG